MDTNFDCTKLDENEKILQEYFALLSKSFGFNDTELLSLYELPGMLADNLDYVKLRLVKHKTEYDFLLGDIPQAYLFSDCKEREHIISNINYSRKDVQIDPSCERYGVLKTVLPWRDTLSGRILFLKRTNACLGLPAAS